MFELKTKILQKELQFEKSFPLQRYFPINSICDNKKFKSKR